MSDERGFDSERRQLQRAASLQFEAEQLRAKALYEKAQRRASRRFLLAMRDAQKRGRDD